MDLAHGAALGRAAGPGLRAAAGQSQSGGIAGGNGVQWSLGKGMARTPPGLVQSSGGTPVCCQWDPQTSAGLTSMQPCAGVGARADPGLPGPP